MTLLLAGVAAIGTSPVRPPSISGTASELIDLNDGTPVAHRRVTIELDPGEAGAANMREFAVSSISGSFAGSETVALLVSVGLPGGYTPIDRFHLRDLCPASGHCNVDADVVFALRDPGVGDTFRWYTSARLEFNDATTVPPGVSIAVSVAEVPQVARAPIIYASESVSLPVGARGTAERSNLSIRSTGQAEPNAGRWLGLLTVDSSTPAGAWFAVQTVVWFPAEGDEVLGTIQDDAGGQFQAELHQLCPALPTCDVTVSVEANRPVGPRPSAAGSGPDVVDVEISALLIWVGAEAPIGEPTLELELTAP